MTNLLIGVGIGVALTVVVYQLIAFFNIFSPWLRGFMSGAPVPLLSLVGMRLRGSPIDFLLEAHRSLAQAGTPVDLQVVESCYVANKHRVNDRDMTSFLKLIHQHRSTHAPKQ